MTGENPAIVVLSSSSLPVAEAIKTATGGEMQGLASRVPKTDIQFEDTARHISNLFKMGRPIIGIMAAGALIRLLAPHLTDKHTEPPVLAVADDGSSVVPLLGGHHGANDLARDIAKALNGHAAITTAGDLRFGVTLDDPPEGWTLANSENTKNVMACILSGADVCMEGDAADIADWIGQSDLKIKADGDVCLFMTTRRKPAALAKADLMFQPRVHAVGIGCERGTGADEILVLVDDVLAKNDIAAASVASVYSIDLKADEAGLQEAAQQLFGAPAHFYDAVTLEAQTSRLANPSDIVFAEVGCHGVAEAAALAAAGPDGKLVVPKVKSKRATVAIARAPNLIDVNETGRTRGHLSVVGIGPGSEDWRSPEVTKLVSRATDLVGYSLYLDLLGPLTIGKMRHDFDLGKEEDRVRHAMELAGEGRDVALVCSGDAGIYAMATLVFELLENGNLSDAARRISIEVSPGISALQGAAARAGAPLGHDFCTISLSDLLTPWHAIQMRIKAAAEADFVIAFYNPVSKRRRTQLAHAKEVLLKHRPADTPVILATNLGREGEAVRVVSLADLKVDDVDMLTVVIVGSSETRTVATGDGKTWVYTPRGYAEKEGTKIRSGL